MNSNEALLVNLDGIMKNYNEACLRLDYNTSVEEATNRVFVLGRKFILSDLKKLAHSFRLKWNFYTARQDRRRICNRTRYQGSVNKQSSRNFKSITCGCDQSIRFRGITRNDNKISDTIIIIIVNEVRSNTCDPPYIDQFVLIRRRADDYKYCDGQYLREIMVQMAIDPFVYVRVMIELLKKLSPDRKNVDMHMINNVKIRARKRRLELDFAQIVIDPKYFDPT